MLNLLAFKLLSDPESVPTPALRLFLRLILDVDLTKYRALNMNRLIADYGLGRNEISKSITYLVNAGVLERGPLSQKPVRLNTYRIAPGCLLSPEDLKDFFAENRRTTERMTLAPKVVAPVVI